MVGLPPFLYCPKFPIVDRHCTGQGSKLAAVDHALSKVASTSLRRSADCTPSGRRAEARATGENRGTEKGCSAIGRIVQNSRALARLSDM